MSMPRRLEGKRALVFGGGSGLGLACAEAMLDEGAKVFITGRRADKLSAAAQRLSARGTIAQAPGDATREADVQRVVAAAAQAMGGLDTLVVSSGVSVI